MLGPPDGPEVDCKGRNARFFEVFASNEAAHSETTLLGGTIGKTVVFAASNA